MPREPVLKHRVQRQFHPSSARTCFASERLLTPPPSSARTLFSIELLAPKPVDGDGNGQPLPPSTTICKPKGEVGRLNRGGYTLKTVLGWKDTEYDELMVCFICFEQLLPN